MRGKASVAVVVVVLGLGLNACTAGSVSSPRPGPPALPSGPAPDATLAATKIKHVVVVMQENRSFDSYFGTYPGADGLPANVCVASPAGGCQRPFHDTQDVNGG